MDASNDRRWAVASKVLLAIAKNDESPRGEAVQRVGNHLPRAKENFNRLGALKLDLSGLSDIWKVAAEHRDEIHRIQQQLSAFLASIQDLHAHLDGTAASASLDELEKRVAIVLIAILPTLIIFANDGVEADEALEMTLLSAALTEWPLSESILDEWPLNWVQPNPGTLRACLEGLVGRRDACARCADYAIASRDVNCAPVIASRRRAGFDLELLDTVLFAAEERADWGTASLIAETAPHVDFRAGAVADALRAFRRSRRLVWDAKRLIGEGYCESASAVLFKMLDNVQELIENFEGADAKLSDEGFACRDSMFASHAVEDVKHAVIAWQAIADDLIRLASTFAGKAAGGIPAKVVAMTVDAYFASLDSRPDRGDGSDGRDLKSLGMIQMDCREKFSADSVRELLEKASLDDAAAARARAANQRKPRRHPGAGNASRRSTVDESRDPPMPEAPSMRVSARMVEEAKDRARGCLSVARQELKSRLPQRRTVLHFLDEGQACLDKAGLATDGFVLERKRLIRQLGLRQWKVWPTEALYVALKDDIEVIPEIERRDMPRVSDTGRPRATGEYIHEIKLRVKGSTNPGDWVVLHVHRVLGKKGWTVAHFKLYKESRKTSRGWDHIHRGFILQPDVVRQILADAGMTGD